MAEILGVAASAISVVGFAGQILQGCQYVCTILDDVKDAPEDIKCFRAEVKLFYYMLSSFRNVLVELERIGKLEDMDDEIKLALNHSSEVVTKLDHMVVKFETMTEGGWKRILVSKRKEKFAKQVARIERAKGYVTAVQNNVNLKYLQKQSLSTQQIGETVTLMNENLSQSNDIISTIPGAFKEFKSTVDNTRDAVSEMREEFAEMMRMAMERILSANSIPLADADVRIEQENNNPTGGQATTYLTQETSAESTHDLPKNMFEDIKATFKDVLLEFYGDHQEFLSNEVELREQATHIEDGHAIVTTNSEFSLNEIGGKVLRQVRYNESYKRRLGNINIRSITRVCKGVATQEGAKAKSTMAWTQIYIDLVPNKKFLDVRVRSSFRLKGLATSQPSFDPVLRVYNSVSWDKPVVEACSSGNISMVENLFSDHQASPFDRVQGDISLLEVILGRILSILKDPLCKGENLDDLCQVFKLIVDLGVDPGDALQLRSDTLSSGSKLPLLASVEVSPNHDSNLVDLTRFILSKSIQDPFEGGNFEEMLWYKQAAALETPVCSILTRQDHWSVPWTTRKHRPRLRAAPKFSNANLLIRDPKARCFVAWFRSNKLNRTNYMLEFEIAELAFIDTTYSGSAYERSIASHIVACVRLMSKDYRKTAVESIINTFRQYQKLHIVTMALSQLGLKTHQIRELYERDAIMSLVFQLAYLNHPTGSYFQSGEICLECLPVVPQKDWTSYTVNFEIQDSVFLTMPQPDSERTADKFLGTMVYICFSIAPLLSGIFGIFVIASPILFGMCLEVFFKSVYIAGLGLKPSRAMV